MKIKGKKTMLLLSLALILLSVSVFLTYLNSKTQVFVDNKGKDIGTETEITFDGEKYFLKVTTVEDIYGKVLIFTDGKDISQVIENGGENSEIPEPKYDTFKYNDENYLIIATSTMGGPRVNAGLRWNLLKFNPETKELEDDVYISDYSDISSEDMTCFIPEYLGDGKLRVWTDETDCGGFTVKEPHEIGIK